MTGTFPGGSRKKVNRAGASIAAGTGSKQDNDIFDEWRASHRQVLNTFQAILRKRTKGKNITVAQRHKRRITIIDKLSRHSGMALARMDDVAGCRLIFNTIDELYEFRRSIHKARFRHNLRNDVDKYDYIKESKSTGYRGIHDVYEYDVNSETGKYLKGLLVEIQYRTLIQHSWATAVEVIGLITHNQPKFERGDSRYIEAMSYASEILARVYESSTGPHSEMSDRNVVARFRGLDRELKLLQLLRGVKVADKALTRGGDIILIFRTDGTLEVRMYASSPTALLDLFALENESDNEDVVLVRGATSHDVRLAYQNYFGDTADFIKLVTEGCTKLSRTSGKKKVITKQK
ncbi:RelA/SpoT domain-containing protein [Pontiellaceae bacterium B1224]|nr:RelA/SpoT domain-containing protein [Pontiellaceae bacterium B1224]